MLHRADGIPADQNTSLVIDRARSAFSPAELQRLALFSLFRRVVDCKALAAMGMREPSPQGKPRDRRNRSHTDTWVLPEAQGFELEDWRDLAGRAGELGIVCPCDLDFWFIETPVAKALSRLLPGEPTPCLRAFVEAMAFRSVALHPGMDSTRTAEWRQIASNEANFSAALALAVGNGWPHAAAAMLDSLQRLWGKPSRLADWRRALNLVAPMFVTADFAARPGLEEEWGNIAFFRAQLLMREKSWKEALDLQLALVAYLEERIEDTRYGRGWFIGATNNLATIQSMVDEPEAAIRVLLQAYEQHSDDRRLARHLAAHLGHLYKSTNLVEAAKWLERARSIEVDAMILSGLADVARSRADALAGTDGSSKECLAFLQEALKYAREAVALLPADDARQAGHVYFQVASILAAMKNYDEALESYRMSVAQRMAAGDFLGAAHSEANIAGLLEVRGYRREAVAGLMKAEQLFLADGSQSGELEMTRKHIERIRNDIEKGSSQ
jgi:tetratricopeptide (TPR) repeat protein